MEVKNMKTKLIILIMAACCAMSCYDSYVGDYSRKACGFANPTDVRSLVVGEGMTFSTGVALGGTINNDLDRRITVGVDYSLVNEATYASLTGHTFPYIVSLMKNVPSISALPAAIYDLESDSGVPGTVVIRKGTHLGVLRVKVDSAAFLSDPGRLYPKQVIPLVITDGNGTEIIKGRETTVIGVRYENMLFGNWYHGGYSEVYDGGGKLVRTDTYPTSIPQADNLVWTLTTTGPFELTANAVGSQFSGDAPQMKLTLGQDDSITVEAVPGAMFEVQPDGESRFLRSRLLQERKIVLNYKYVSGTETIHAHDTLTFRNRIRDGVNEWQDENPDHYE